ncbi:hypothetical protein [Flectobacillus major]|jgi:hypothetical protein|uniref:hypothetical protein n=1 Tax=Flectobacillus major TaxID=103 RepID=UPI00047C9D64|nr:hypothetical protein [Flectobacillus major]
MLRIITLTIVVGLIFYLAPYLGLSAFIHADKWFILAFYTAISYFNHLLMQQGFANDRKNFVPFYMGSIAARLLLSLVFIGIFIFRGTPDIYIFISNFFVLYLCYTGFEIYDLYRNLRHFS